MRKILVPLIFLFVIINSGATFAETGKKAPKKTRPVFPKLTQLPSPFNRWNICDLALRLYPNYTCNSGRLDETNVGSVETVSIWNEQGKKHLLALFVKFEAGDKSESSGKSVDIALFDIKDNDIKMVAFSKDVISYREYGSSYFDLAPYKLNSNETAVGVRANPGISGGGSEEEILYLFRINGNKFQQIFTRIMFDTEYYGGYENLSNKLHTKSILQIVPQSSGMNDFKIITRYYRINDADQDENDIVKTASELWRWDQNKQAYQLSK